MPGKRPPPVMETLRLRLTQSLAPTLLQITDDSAAHAGHAGARSGGHFAVRVHSTRFAGLGLLARHRLVYTAVADLLLEGIHALQIDARAPDEIG